MFRAIIRADKRSFIKKNIMATDLIPFEFPNPKDKSKYNNYSFLGELFKGLSRPTKTIPLDCIGVLTYGDGGRIVAYFREGGTYIDNPMYSVQYRSNKNLEIKFNPNGQEGHNFAVSTATAEGSVYYKTDFIRMYTEALQRSRGTRPGDNLLAEKVWKNELKDTVMSIQTILFPGIVFSLDIDVSDTAVTVGTTNPGLPNWQRNIDLFWKNVRGDNEAARKEYLESQFVSNVQEALNEVCKKFTYGQLTALLRVNALSFEVLERVNILNGEQELGLNIRTCTVSALHAPVAIHTSQMDISKAKAKKVQTAIENDIALNAAKKLADGKAYANRVEGKAEAAKQKLLNIAKAKLTELEGLAKAKGEKASAKIDIDAIKDLLKTAAKIKGIDPQIVLESNAKIKIAEAYSASGKGTVIVENGGGQSNGNVVQMTILVDVLKRIADGLAAR